MVEDRPWSSAGIVSGNDGGRSDDGANGGRNRTEKELRELLTAGGFRLERVLSTTGPDVAVASLVE